ncbi:MAG: hypothetical protein ACYC91_12680 [Solirubrobacteraceae bacterium]
MRRHPWWTVSLGLVVLSTVLVLWAGTRPSYDAYGWLVWGYQTLRFTLDLGGAPSWKPLPYLFTVPFAFAGHYELYLWMITVTVISLAGSVFAGRITFRLLEGYEPERRRAAIAGAVFAGAAVLGLEDYMHYILSAQSDPMIVTFVLAAVDMHLSGKPRWAFWFWVLASLGRPEAWPFIALYSLWVWRRVPSMRWMIFAGAFVVLFMWFGVPTITNHRPFVAAQLALKSPRELKQNKIIGTLGRFTELEYLPVWLAALGGLAWAYFRKHWLVLGLAACCVLWVIVEIAFALHGWPALPRYVMEPAAICAVFAGLAIGWLLSDVPRVLRRIPSWASLIVVAAVVVALVPAAVARMRAERRDMSHERARTTEINRMNSFFGVLGGVPHIRRCGEPVVNVEWVSAMAWTMHLDVGFVGHRPAFELHQKYPIVLFKTLSDGWQALPWHTVPSKLIRCAGLHSKYVFTRRHPGGIRVRLHGAA